MSSLDLLILHIEIEITDNIKKIMQKWDDLIGTTINVYSMNNLPDNLSNMKNNLAVAQFHKIFGFLNIYISDKYEEAHIIHEILHPLLHAENYVQLSPVDSFKLFTKYPNFMKMVKSYTMTVTNQMDHLIINQQMKEYDLDFNKLASIEFEDALKVEYNPHYENKVECILNNMLIGLHYFDYINMIEPYKSKLVSLLKENNKEAYNHGKKFYTVVSNNGYNTKKQYRKSMEILLNEMKQEYKKVVNDKSIYSRFFDLVCIK